METYGEIRFWCNLKAGLEYISENLETIVGSLDLLFLALLCNGYISRLYRQYTIISLAGSVSIGEVKLPQLLLWNKTCMLQCV